jgi:hypothetical protein
MNLNMKYKFQKMFITMIKTIHIIQITLIFLHFLLIKCMNCSITLEFNYLGQDLKECIGFYNKVKNNLT